MTAAYSTPPGASAATTAVLAGENPGANKIEGAAKHGVPVIGEAEWREFAAMAATVSAASALSA